MTLNIGESPNEEKESFLSQILEDSPLQKYYLTKRGCEGIINRAKTRGVSLRNNLITAVKRQIEAYEKE